MAQWGGTEEADRGTTYRFWVWERLTWTILALGGLVSAGLVAWDMTGGTHRGDAGAALAGLLVYLALCALIVRVDRAMNVILLAFWFLGTLDEAFFAVAT